MEIDMDKAQEAYDKNLSTLLQKVRSDSRGVYRVMMSDIGLIVSITFCGRKVGKPQRNCFTMYVAGEGKPPRFGSLNGLRDYQVQIAELLYQDLIKILETNEKAYCLKTGTSPVLDSHVQEYVNELTDRFGMLPEPVLKRKDEIAKTRQIQLRAREEEKQQILDEIPSGIFEQYLAEEKQRQGSKNHLTIS